MCETLGTDWEATARENILLKLEAWQALQRVLEAIARVRELHKPDENGRYCIECDPESCGCAGFVYYPCPTIKALDGEQ